MPSGKIGLFVALVACGLGGKAVGLVVVLGSKKSVAFTSSKARFLIQIFY